MAQAARLDQDRCGLDAEQAGRRAQECGPARRLDDAVIDRLDQGVGADFFPLHANASCGDPSGGHSGLSNKQPGEVLMSELVESLSQDPQSYVHAHYNEGFSLRREERDAIALAGLRKRFKQLGSALPALGKLAADQGIHEINSIDDAAPLLFPHTVYKSYPLSFLEKGQFDRLTKWLGGLTTVDLKGVDLTGVDSIDEWIARIEQATDINLIHTFGTTGKLSFLPRTKTQTALTATINAHCIRDWSGYNSGPDIL